MNTVKNALVSTKNFVVNHKVAIAVTATAAVTTAVVVKMHGRDLNAINEFLEEKGLFDEFYNPTKDN